MKKIFLSSIVVVSFLAYAFFYDRTGSYISTGNVLSELSPTPSPFLSDPTSTKQPSPTPKGKYKDGTYTSDTVDVVYGNVRIQATISGGKMTDIKFLQYPSDRRTSARISAKATPILAQEAITAQSEQVDIVSGATQTSEGFIQALQGVLASAQ